VIVIVAVTAVFFVG